MPNSVNFLIAIKQQGAQAAIAEMQPLISTLEQLGQVNVKITPGTNQLANSQRNLGTALAGLTSRALLTIPVWMALREVFMGGIRATEDSIKSIIDMDTALKHLEMQLVGTKNAAQILSQVKVNSQALAIQTGEAPATLIDVFNQLVTVGFSVQDAFKGMDTAAKGALVTNEDSKDITNTLVNVYKELGSSITAVHSPAEKLNYILDTMTVLMQKNHIGIKDFEAGLKTFAGQAAVSNLTIDQTLSLLAAEANVSQTGQFAGRGLSGIFRQITNQRAGVEELLGKSTSGQSDWETFQQVLTKIQSIKPTDTAGVEAITKIFSLRGGGQALRALAEDAGHLTDNLKLLYSLSPDERQAVFTGRLTVALAMIQHQADITKQTVELLGRTFIESAAGTDDFATALTHINKALLDMKPAAEGAGSVIHGLVSIIQASGISGLLSGFNSGNINNLNTGNPAAPGQSDSKNPLKNFFRSVSPSNIFTALGLWNESFTDKANLANGEDVETGANIRLMIEKQRKAAGLAPLAGYAKTTQIDQNTPDLVQASKGNTDEKLKQVQMEEQLKSLGYDKIQTLQYELELLKQQHNYGDGTKQQLEDQLTLAKQINNEKKSRNEFDSDDTKLFEIARKYGHDVAKDIGGVIQDSSKYNTLTDQEKGIFAKQFSSYDTSRQARNYFGRNQYGQVGEGSDIPINNIALRNQGSDAITSLLRGLNGTSVTRYADANYYNAGGGVGISTGKPVTITLNNNFTVHGSSKEENAEYIIKQLKTFGSAVAKAVTYGMYGNNYDDSKVQGN